MDCVSVGFCNSGHFTSCFELLLFSVNEKCSEQDGSFWKVYSHTAEVRVQAFISPARLPHHAHPSIRLPADTSTGLFGTGGSGPARPWSCWVSVLPGPLATSLQRVGKPTDTAVWLARGACGMERGERWSWRMFAAHDQPWATWAVAMTTQQQLELVMQVLISAQAAAQCFITVYLVVIRLLFNFTGYTASNKL